MHCKLCRLPSLPGEEYCPVHINRVRDDVRVEDAKQKMKWNRAPSVWTGGKAYFWTGVKSGERYWVDWNRAEKMWEVSKEKKTGGYVDRLAFFKTAEAAKRFVEER